MSPSAAKNSKEYFIAYSLMINAAQHQGFCTYQEIAQAVGLPTAGSYMGSVVGELLGNISENEVSLGRPMLSAIVVGVNGQPGSGFIPYAKELGLFKDGMMKIHSGRRNARKSMRNGRLTTGSAIISKGGFMEQAIFCFYLTGDLSGFVSE